MQRRPELAADPPLRHHRRRVGERPARTPLRPRSPITSLSGSIRVRYEVRPAGTRGCRGSSWRTRSPACCPPMGHRRRARSRHDGRRRHGRGLVARWILPPGGASRAGAAAPIRAPRAGARSRSTPRNDGAGRRDRGDGSARTSDIAAPTAQERAGDGPLGGGSSLLASARSRSALRVIGLQYGLPAVYNPDEVAIMARALSFARGTLNPHNFLYPTFYFYVLFAWVGVVSGVGLAQRARGIDRRRCSSSTSPIRPVSTPPGARSASLRARQRCGSCTGSRRG